MFSTDTKYIHPCRGLLFELTVLVNTSNTKQKKKN